MRILIPIKLVPDLVEELEIDESGKSLDMSWLSLIINEYDDHAIEQAILLKEKHEAEVVVLAPDMDESDDILFSAVAKGADRIIKIQGFDDLGLSNYSIAKAFATVIEDVQPDIILAGVQAHNDLDGQIGPILAELVSLPYVGYVAGVEISGEEVIVSKEFPGGVIARMAVKTPCVLGIQAASEPPRYVAFSKIRQASKTSSIEEQLVEIVQERELLINQMNQPEVLERAEMIEGEAEDIAAELLNILRDKGLI